MPWKETVPGRYERPFDTMEQMYRSVSAAFAPINRDNAAITAVLQLRLGPTIADPQSALRHAWKTLRYALPQIAAYAHENTYIYDTLSPSDPSRLESWLTETFIVEPDTSSPAHLHRESNPTTYAQMHFFPQTSEIAFRAPHWRIDGIGTLHLLNTFLSFLAHPQPIIAFGTEGKNLLPPLDEAVSIPMTPTPEARKEAKAIVTNYANNIPSIGLPPTSSATLPAATASCILTLSRDRTAKIIGACKAHHVTVTTAVHAAIITAISQHKPGPTNPKSKYSAWCTFDVRKYCEKPFNGRANAVSVFHTGFLAVVEPGCWGENVRGLGEVYGWDPRRCWGYLPFYLGELGGVVGRVEGEEQGGGEEVGRACEPWVSSLGIVDGFLGGEGEGEGEGGGKVRVGEGEVKVEGFWMGVEVLMTHVVVFVWTWRGELVLSGCFNEAFYTGECVRGFLEDVERVLGEGLGV